MPHRFTHVMAFLLAAVALLITCTELPIDPAVNPDNASVRLILEKGEEAVAENGAIKKIGLELRLTNLLDSVRVSSECGVIDTEFVADSSYQSDTVWFSPRFTDEGSCVLTAEATMRDGKLRGKEHSLSIHVLPEKPGVHFIGIPSACTLTTDSDDTLVFVTSTTGGARVPTYTMTVTPEEGEEYFEVEYSETKDTVRVIASPQAGGEYEIKLVAASTYEDDSLTDAAAVTVTVEDPVVPSVVHAPEQIITGNADTLVFAVDNSSRPDPLTISLLVDPPLDTSVFTILQTGADSILIAVSENAAPSSSATIGIITCNATESDTLWYPVSLISPEAALWNTTSLDLNLVEGTLFTLNLSEYISVVDMEDISLSADVGTIENNVWNVTPAWGCAEALSATITAIKGDISLDLALTLSVAAGDEVKPVVALVDETLDGKKVSSSQITVECKVTDVGAGVDEVVLSCGEETVTATLQSDDVYSGVINGLEHAVPAQITITATDGSRAKNTGTQTFTVTRDTTMLDGEAPAIVKKSGALSGDRVKTGEGTLEFTVNDNSGVDSVWWTLNGEYVGTLEPDSGTVTLEYVLSAYGESTVAVFARDGSQNHNTGSVSTTITYNTVPSAVLLTTPSVNAEGIGATPTFSWSGADDADGDTVFCRVLNRKGSDASFTAGTEVTGKSYTLPDAAKLVPYTLYVWKVIAYTKTYPDTVSSNESEFTTFDSTAEDLTGPAIAGITAPVDGSRVLDANGSFTVSVSDQSEVDSVWLMLNGVFTGKLTPQGGVCTVAYSQLKKGSNTIMVVAQDKATAKNRDSLEMTLVYNTRPVPSVVPVVFPEEAASGVSVTPQLVWNRVTDAEGDAVYYVVSYGKSKVNLDKKLAETGDTSVTLLAAQKLDANVTWYWRVTAYTKTPYADTVSSEVHSFTTVGVAANITKSPESSTKCAGELVSFTIEAAGTGTLSYQWKRNGTDIAGAVSASYAINAVAMSDTGRYTCFVTNGVGSGVTSEAAKLTVNAAPKITGQPASVAACVGTVASFSVTASGGGTLTYQWKKGSETISGATSDTYSISSVGVSDAGSYTCVVSNGCGNVETSPAASLTINTQPTISTQPQSATKCIGSSITFTVAASGGGTYTYQWKKGGTNISGAHGSSYSITNIQSSHAGSYTCVVSNGCGSGSESNIATLTVPSALSITSHPQSVSKWGSETAYFSVSATGSGLTYQWKRGTSNISGATSREYSISGIDPSTDNGAKFSCVVSDGCGSSITSNSATLTVKAVKAVSAGNAHTLILMTNGDLYACGDNSNGQLGDGTKTDRLSPVLMTSNVKSISAGNGHSLILKNDGSALACGKNYNGQLGDNSQTDRNTLVAIQGVSDVQGLYAGDQYSIIMESGGTLAAVGINAFGCLGIGTRTSPILESKFSLSLAGSVTLSESANSSYAITQKGVLMGVGDDNYFALGVPWPDNYTDHHIDWVEISTNVSKVAAGWRFALFLSNSSLYAFGDNSNGQFGNGTTISTSNDHMAPFAITGMTNVASIAAGYGHSLALKTNGTLWACGSNNAGQLGNGSSGSYETDYDQVAADVVKMDGGFNYTVFVKTDGTFWACGYNSDGQLGDGTTTNQSTPVQIKW